MKKSTRDCVNIILTPQQTETASCTIFITSDFFHYREMCFRSQVRVQVTLDQHQLTALAEDAHYDRKIQILPGTDRRSSVTTIALLEVDDNHNLTEHI